MDVGTPGVPGEELDAEQRAVVAAGDGPVVVTAGPGSGKTRTLVARVAALIEGGRALPEQMLVVTFTNKAAREVRERLETLLAGRDLESSLRVGTFHRLALELLREADGSCSAVLDAVESRQALAMALRQAGRGGSLREAARVISLAKASTDPEAALAGSGYESVWRAYMDRLAVYGACDFDDILLRLRELLRVDPVLRERLQHRFSHVFVDEFQDVNAVQYDLVKLLAGDGRGLMVIGDPDQAIYGFRGAQPRFFTCLLQEYPTAQSFFLRTNYRSQAVIVEAAQGVIGAGVPRLRRELRPVRPAGAEIRVESVSGEVAEGIAIAREIQRQMGGTDMQQTDEDTGGGARSPGDFAVLFRTAAQATVLEECLVKAGIPYRLIGHRSFLEADAVRAAVCFARYMLDPEDPLRQFHVLTLPQFAVPGLDAAGLEARLRRAGESATTVQEPQLERAREHLRATAGEFSALSPAEFVHAWTSRYGDGEDADLAELERFAVETGSLEEWLARILWGREADFERRGRGGSPGRNAEAVSLLTLHAAKGLEFPVVFLCGVEDGWLPLRNADTEVEEERRLFYVGLTRARDELILLHARSRMRNGRRIRPEPSPFLADIPATLRTDEEPPPAARGRGVEQMSLW